MSERAGWDQSEEHTETEIERAINSSWNSPFEGLTEGNPKAAAAEAIWAVHSAAKQQAEMSNRHRGLTESPYQTLIERRDELMSRLSEEEQRQAVMMAQLAIGYVEDPDLPDQLSAMQEDLMHGIVEAKERKG